MINLNNTTPSAPSGSVNVSWQQDGSGNVSASTSFGAISKNTFSPVSGVLTLDCSATNSFYVNVNAAITSMSLTNAFDGEEITILWAQDSTGHSITLASNLLGATAPSTGANTKSCQKFTYNLADTNWYAVSAGVTGMV